MYRITPSDPSSYSVFVRFSSPHLLQEVDPKVEGDELSDEGLDGFLSELTNAIPGVDEAMSFAEMLK